MPELRKDYILDRYVIIATERAKRPEQFKKEPATPTDPKDCFFCPGHEDQTPPEIRRIGDKNKWDMRVFPNKFGIVEDSGNPNRKSTDEFFTSAAGYGKHEVIVETPTHTDDITVLKEKDFKVLFDLYNERINELSKDKHIKYVVVIKNHGQEGGTSIYHTHSQIVAYNLVPRLVKSEVKAAKDHKECPYCKIIPIESKSERRCFENKSFVAFCPYASRFNFEVWVFPKKHVKTLNDLDEKEMKDLASIMRKIILKIKDLNSSYNYFLHYAPDGDDLHFHIEVTPRIAKWAGLELCAETIVNIVSPEQAAEFYRK